MEERIKVVFGIMNGSDWTGGLVYQQNLFTALHRYGPQVDTYFFTGHMQGVVPNGMKADEHYKFVGYTRQQGRYSQTLNRVALRLTGMDYSLRSVYYDAVPGGADVTFNLPRTFRRNLFAGKRVASLFWIPDFQHIHYPQLFSVEEVNGRDAHYLRYAREATLMVLSSNDALRDFGRFAPAYAHKGRVMHFTAHVEPGIYDLDPEAIIAKNKLPEKFIYMPNQFWAHKNHAVVFEAMKILKERGVCVHVVCTGIQNDRRNPAYFPGLMAKIKEWKLTDQVSLLGIIPHEDVYMLYRQAICIINPSIFEGWSTSVEETKSIGKRIMLADIAVHREQDPPDAIFFDPRDPEALADIMERCWAACSSGPDLALEAKARSGLPARMKEYAETFTRISLEAKEIAGGARHTR